MKKTRYIKLVLVSGIMIAIPAMANNDHLNLKTIEFPEKKTNALDYYPTNEPFSHHHKAKSDSTHSVSHGGFGYYGRHASA